MKRRYHDHLPEVRRVRVRLVVTDADLAWLSGLEFCPACGISMDAYSICDDCGRVFCVAGCEIAQLSPEWHLVHLLGSGGWRYGPVV